MNSNRLDLFRYRLKRKQGKKQKTREESANNTTSQKNEEGRLDTITENTNVSQFLSKDLASTVDGLFARLVYNMVVVNYRLGHRSTKQFFFRALHRLKIKHTKEWSFMDKVPYDVLDHAISDAIQARDEVIRRININIMFFILDLRKMIVHPCSILSRTTSFLYQAPT